MQSLVKPNLSQKVSKAFRAVLNDQPLAQRAAVGISEKAVVLALADIQPHDEVLLRSTDLFLELTKMIDAVKLNPVHGNLLLAVKRLWVMATLDYQEVTALSTR
jgi:hypothetical protein